MERIVARVYIDKVLVTTVVGYAEETAQQLVSRVQGSIQVSPSKP